LQHSLVNHKLCRTEVLLQIEDLPAVMDLDLEPVAAEVEQEPLVLLRHPEELLVEVPEVPVILGHLPLTLMAAAEEEDLMRQQEPVGQEAAVQVVHQAQTVHQVPSILAEAEEEQCKDSQLPMVAAADLV
jgi:hypothetical protein